MDPITIPYVEQSYILRWVNANSRYRGKEQSLANAGSVRSVNTSSSTKVSLEPTGLISFSFYFLISIHKDRQTGGGSEGWPVTPLQQAPLTLSFF